MQNIRIPVPLQGTGTSARSLDRFRLVTLYEDHDMGRKAQQLCDTLDRGFRDSEVHQTLWRFDILEFPDSRRKAAAEIKSADLILLAMRSHSSLPPMLETLLENALPDNAGGTALVLVLLDEVCDSSPAVGRLREIAESHDIEVLLRVLPKFQYN